MNLRIAEVLYKLDQEIDSLKAIEQCEQSIKSKDLYLVHLLKGKCFDKQRKFELAIDQYTLAL